MASVFCNLKHFITRHNLTHSFFMFSFFFFFLSLFCLFFVNFFCFAFIYLFILELGKGASLQFSTKKISFG